MDMTSTNNIVLREFDMKESLGSDIKTNIKKALAVAL